MFAAYLIVTTLTAATNAYVAVNDFTQAEWVIANMNKVGLPAWSLRPLGALKALGAFGLVAGVLVPALGITAAAGLVLFFTGAVIAHARAGVAGYQYPGAFLLLAIGSLALRLTTF